MSKILIVDDEDGIRCMLKNVLFTYGKFKDIEEVDNGKDAIIKYNALKPDLVIMDLIMHGTDGLQALKRIISIHPKAKIIILTGHGQTLLIKRCIEAGAKDFIIKPFDNKKFIERIKKVLGAE